MEVSFIKGDFKLSKTTSKKPLLSKAISKLLGDQAEILAKSLRRSVGDW